MVLYKMIRFSGITSYVSTVLKNRVTVTVNSIIRMIVPQVQTSRHISLVGGAGLLSGLVWPGSEQLVIDEVTSGHLWSTMVK